MESILLLLSLRKFIKDGKSRPFRLIYSPYIMSELDKNELMVLAIENKRNKIFKCIFYSMNIRDINYRKIIDTSIFNNNSKALKLILKTIIIDTWNYNDSLLFCLICGNPKLFAIIEYFITSCFINYVYINSRIPLVNYEKSLNSERKKLAKKGGR